MTTLYLASLVTAISNISITSVTVKDKDEIAASWISQPNVLYPNPENFIELNQPPSYNIAGGLQGITYTLNYRFLSTQIGGVETFPAAYSDLLNKVIVILDAIVDVLTPYANVDMKLSGLSIGGREDLAGNQYHGADISLLIEESH